jgi:hypothetical protein
MSKYQVRDLHVVIVDGTGVHADEVCFVAFDTATSHTVLSGFVPTAKDVVLAIDRWATAHGYTSRDVIVVGDKAL